jgi:hypothetical protein
MPKLAWVRLKAFDGKVSHKYMDSKARKAIQLTLVLDRFSDGIERR